MLNSWFKNRVFMENVEFIDSMFYGVGTTLYWLGKYQFTLDELVRDNEGKRIVVNKNSLPEVYFCIIND
jgi:hypothetical protein